MWSIMDKRYDWFSVLESTELETWVSKLSSGAIEVYESNHSSRGASKQSRHQEFTKISRHLISALYSAIHARSTKKLWVSSTIHADKIQYNTEIFMRMLVKRIRFNLRIQLNYIRNLSAANSARLRAILKR